MVHGCCCIGPPRRSLPLDAELLLEWGEPALDEICLKAYAKINLTLDVVGKRQDGYHLLQSVMQSIDLCDLVSLRKAPQGISLAVNDPAVPADAQNTAWRAAEMFLNLREIRAGAAIAIEKQIPAAAGLGGGSADAAAVLVGLDRLYGTGLSPTALQEMALSVGADVPFCIQGGTQFAEGIGEQLTELPPVPNAAFVLVKPRAGMATQRVYQMLEPSVFGTQYSQEFIRQLVKGENWQALARTMGNVLESVTAKLVPEVGIWERRLLESGVLGTVMSGSGPTVVGIFSTADQARHFHDRWQGQAMIVLSHPVERGVGQSNGGDR